MDFSANGRGRAGNRAIGLIVVVALHLLLAWGLMLGLARRPVEPQPVTMETRIIQEQRPAQELPEPPPPPEFEPPPLPYIPPPEVVIQPPPVPRVAITRSAPEPAPPPPPEPVAAPPAPVRVAPTIDFKGSPRACREPEYPAVSERRGEQGTSAISLLISAEGKVTQTRVDASSGHVRLDEAAIRAFSRCRFIVGTVDGVPEASWFSIRYRWLIRE